MNNLEKIVDINANINPKLDNINCCNCFSRKINNNNNNNNNNSIKNQLCNFFKKKSKKYNKDDLSINSVRIFKYTDHDIIYCYCEDCLNKKKLLEMAIINNDIPYQKNITI